MPVKKKKSKNHTQTRFIFKASFLDYFLFQGYFSVKFIIYSQTQKQTGQSSSGLPTAAKELNAVTV